MTFERYSDLFHSYSVEVREAMRGPTFVHQAVWRVVETLCELGIEKDPDPKVVRAIRLSLSLDK